MSLTLQPEATAKVSEQLDALLHRAALAPLHSKAWLHVTGSDASRWLNGMVTNNIANLAPGEGNYNFLLNAQGRIVGDCTIYREPTATATEFLLETDSAQIETIQQHLDKFIIMDDVELNRPDPPLTGILLVGPNASHPLTSAADSPLPSPGGHASKVDLNGHQALVLTRPSSWLPLYEIWFTSAASAEHTFLTFKTALQTEASPQALETLRILSGTPRYGTDIRNTESAKDLPQETAQPHALHFSKGCYLGQEIVERIHSRGNVHRTFSGFQLTGSLPTVGTTLQAEGKSVGELTSVSAIDLPSGQIQLALGYIRREALLASETRSLTLEYPSGTATPIKLPYQGIS